LHATNIQSCQVLIFLIFIPCVFAIYAFWLCWESYAKKLIALSIHSNIPYSII